MTPKTQTKGDAVPLIDKDTIKKNKEKEAALKKDN